MAAVSKTTAAILALATETVTGLNGHCCSAWKSPVNTNPARKDAKTKYPVMDSLLEV